MSLAARSPRSRKSLSLSEHNLNHLDLNTNLTMPVTKLSGKKRGVSIGGEGLSSLSMPIAATSSVDSQMGKGDELSPRRKARRSMQPRKSILKAGLTASVSGPSLSAGNDDLTTDFTTLTHQYAHTIAFPPMTEDMSKGRPSLARRVSFAPNAHVRMFEPAPKPAKESSKRHSLNIFASQPPTLSAPRPSASASSSHARRSSIQNISALKAPTSPMPGSKSPSKAAAAPVSPRPPTVVIVSEDFGEESMEIESESGDSDEFDDDAVDMAPRVSVTYAEVAEEEDVDAEGEDEDEEEEMDMEETGVYGGIIPRQSIGGIQFDADTSGTTDAEEGDSENIDSVLQDDEEKTMDFTIAVGGIVPSQAPVGATAGRASIGYSLPNGAASERLIPGQGSDVADGEMEMEMDETVAYGGIIQADDSLSSADDTINSRVNGGERTMTFSFPAGQGSHDDDDAMDMTVAHGGIVSFPATQSSVPASQSSVPTPLRSPMPSNTRPMGGTPSFARPTQASAQKSREKQEKRNVFAPSPSPSPTKTPRPTTPNSRMSAAGDVAKRLSFASTTSSGGKRKREEEEVNSEVEVATLTSASKRVKVLSTDEVFSAPTPPPAGPLSALPSRTPGTPRRSLGTPVRLKSPATAAMGSASRASLLASAERPSIGLPSAGPVIVEEEEIEEEGGENEAGWDDTPPTIALSAFLEMAGVQFMDSLPLLNRRRSSVGRGILGQGLSAADRDFSLHDYTEAQLNSIFLNMYNWASDKMKEDIRLGQEELVEAEEMCSVENPPVIRDYLGAPDEDRPLFEMTFKTFKTNTHLRARERWYDWKQNLMERIKPDVEDVLAGMQEDNERLTTLRAQADAILPDLQARHAALKAELEKERAIVAEISACDQAELAELKAGVEEQSTQIQVFKHDLEESTAKADELDAKLAELNSVKAEHAAAIQLARSKCDKFTKSDVARLQEEYDSLQHLHMWRPTRVDATVLELQYDGELKLSIPCSNHVPSVAGAKLELVPGKILAAGPTEALFALVAEDVERTRSRRGELAVSLVRRVGQLWTAVQRLQQELRVLAFRLPLSYAFHPGTAIMGKVGGGNVTITASVVLPTKSKVAVDFVIKADQLVRWPEGVADVDVSARTVYGSADAEAFASIVGDTVRSAVAYVPGVFVQGCVDAAVACA